MDSVPREIVSIILSKCDDSTKRKARLACRMWFNLIDYRYFTLYFTKESEWPQIVNRLSQYSKPICLNLRKTFMKKLEDINKHLLQLTDLTSLSLDKISAEDDLEWFKLTTLSNLQSFNISSTISNAVATALPFCFNDLTSVTLPYSTSPYEEAKLEQSIKQWTNLACLSITQNGIIDFPNLFQRHYWQLTILKIQTPKPIADSTLKTWLDSVGNLKCLEISTSNDMMAAISLQRLTALEHLFCNRIQFSEVNSQKLTSLSLLNMEEKTIERMLPAINTRNLRKLIVGLPYLYDPEQEVYSYSWLTALTALDHIELSPLYHGGLKYLPTTLTNLKIHVDEDRVADLTYISRLRSLKHLHITGTGTIDISAIETLTTLVSLQLPTYEQFNHQLNFSVLSNLTHLTADCQASEVMNLPNMKQLILREAAYHQNISTFSLLECLNIRTIGEDDYEHLSGLTRLTALTIWNAISSEKVVQLPTSLQELHIGFDSFLSDSLRDQLLARLPNLYEGTF